MSSDLIDRSALVRLLEILGNDPAELEDLLADYNEDAPELARRIRDAAESGETDALRIAAHSLKANARDFGALHLSELCTGLEQDCIEGRTDNSKEAAVRIAQAESDAREALAQIDFAALDGASGTG